MLASGLTWFNLLCCLRRAVFFFKSFFSFSSVSIRFDIPFLFARIGFESISVFNSLEKTEEISFCTIAGFFFLVKDSVSLISPMLDDSLFTLGDVAETDDIQTITEMFYNERNSPKLLKNCDALVCNVLELIENQMALVAELASNERTLYESKLYEMEIERVKYLLSLYLRTRLDKIESRLFIMSEQEVGHLSENEYKFYRSLDKTVETHFHTIVYNLPQQLQTYKHVSEERDPLVSVLVLNDVGQFLLDPTNGISENLQKDDIYIVKFSAIEPLLESKDVMLI